MNVIVHFILKSFIFDQLYLVNSKDVVMNELIYINNNLYIEHWNVFSLQNLISNYYPKYGMENLHQDDPIEFLQKIIDIINLESMEIFESKITELNFSCLYSTCKHCQVKGIGILCVDIKMNINEELLIKQVFIFIYILLKINTIFLRLKVSYKILKLNIVIHAKKLNNLICFCQKFYLLIVMVMAMIIKLLKITKITFYLKEI